MSLSLSLSLAIKNLSRGSSFLWGPSVAQHLKSWSVPPQTTDVNSATTACSAWGTPGTWGAINLCHPLKQASSLRIWITNVKNCYSRQLRHHSLSHQTLQNKEIYGEDKHGLFTKSQATGIWKLPVKPGRQRKYVLTPKGSYRRKIRVFFCDYFLKTWLF